MNAIKKEWRFILVAFFLAALFVVLVFRMLMLQVFDMDGGVGFLKSQGDARTVRTEVIPGHRGMITDRNGQPLAVSTPVVSIFMNPREMVLAKDYEYPLSDKDKKELAAFENKLTRLVKKLGSTEAAFKNRFGRFKSKQFVYLKRHMSPAEAEKILSLRIKGIYGQEEYRRFYPAGEVTSHLVGFTNINDEGQEGFEFAYDEWLRGSSGSKEVVQDLLHRTIKDLRLVEEPVPGKDVALSIDLRLQYLAYRALKEAVAKHRADAGSAVVLDVETGEVLAMVNQPGFNPNDRSRMKIDTVRNRAVSDIFEPGSTVKPLTMVAALESGKFRPNTKVDTRPGFIKVGKKTLLDPVNYGVIDLTKIITKSSQVGTTKVALELGQESLHEVFYRMGLGQYVGTGFPGESTGLLPNKSQWTPIEKATFAFGHGVSVTALQLAQAYSVFASGGIKRPVSLTRIEDNQSYEGEQVISASLADDIVDMLAAVTGPQGTAKKANTEAYTVAGKTGTSHKVGSGGYESGKYMSIFAGLAPVGSPKLVTVVVVDDPKGKEYFGGEVAAPVFSEIVSDGLRVLNVAPDKTVSGDNMLAGGL